MWFVFVNDERMSVVPTGKGVVGITVPIVVIACAFDAPGVVGIEGKGECLGSKAVLEIKLCGAGSLPGR